MLTTDVNTIENASGVEQNVAGTGVQQRMVVFLSNERLILMTVSTLPQFREAIFQPVDQSGGSLELLN